jgi:organic hydroperoxide reductase OsmC/OhrA
VGISGSWGDVSSPKNHYFRKHNKHENTSLYRRFGMVRPKVTIDLEKSVDNAEELAISLHHKAHEKCFIANSVNTTVNCEPMVVIK